MLSADLSATTVKADTPTEVTLQVSVQGAVNVSGFGVSVEYDTAAVSFVSGEVGEFMTGATSPGPDLTTPGVVGIRGAIIAAVNDTALAPDGDGVLATFTFSVTLAEGQETVLKVSEVQLLGVPASKKDVLTPADLSVTITGESVIVGPVTYYVSPAGNDTSGDGLQSTPWRTISYAVSRASAGDTIKVMDDDDEATDDYIENINVGKSLTIERYDYTGANPPGRGK